VSTLTVVVVAAESHAATPDRNSFDRLFALLSGAVPRQSRVLLAATPDVPDTVAPEWVRPVRVPPGPLGVGGGGLAAAAAAAAPARGSVLLLSARLHPSRQSLAAMLASRRSVLLAASGAKGPTILDADGVAVRVGYGYQHPWGCVALFRGPDVALFARAAGDPARRHLTLAEAVSAALDAGLRCGVVHATHGSIRPWYGKNKPPVGDRGIP
jgi:hypothetical protein